LRPESSTARSRVGRLTTVASTVSAYPRAVDGDLVRPRSPGTHNVAGKPRLAYRVGTPGQQADRRIDLLLFLNRVGDPQQVPLVPHDPGEPQTLQLRDRLCQLESVATGADPHAVQPQVDLENHAGGDPCGPADRGERFGLREVVDGDNRVGMPAECGNPLPLPLTHHHRGNQDVADPPRRHHLGFRDFRTGHANRPGGEFQLGNRRGLVALLVRPPLHPPSRAGRRHLADIRLHAVEVNAQQGSVEVRLRGTNQ
jgi:hypothetical protein